MSDILRNNVLNERNGKLNKLFVTSITVFLLVFGMLGTASANLANEIESNDTLATAQDIDAYFSTGYNSDIEYSGTIPWVSISGTGNGTFDYYSFTVESLSRVILDIDYGYGGSGSVDTELGLWTADGSLITSNDDRSYSNLDAYIFTTLTTGTYIVGVAEYNSWAGYGGWSHSSNRLDWGDTYTLQVSVQNPGQTAPVPEPATLLLLGAGLSGIAGLRRKFKK